jgi:hypothetical protein
MIEQGVGLLRQGSRMSPGQQDATIPSRGGVSFWQRGRW